MTISHNQSKTSDRWTGTFDNETLWEDPQKQENELQPEQSAEFAEAGQNRDDNRILEDFLENENENADEVSVINNDDSEENDEAHKQKAIGSDFFCCRSFPRISLVVIGILLPLWALVSISAVFGFALSSVESPREGKWLIFSIFS